MLREKYFHLRSIVLLHFVTVNIVAARYRLMRAVYSEALIKYDTLHH